MSDDGRVDEPGEIAVDPARLTCRFANNYGASVITIHGGRELAMLWFDGDEQHVTHMDGLVSDVVKIRDQVHLFELLDRIAALPA